MKKNVKVRGAVIVATILLCVYGIIDFPKSMSELKQNFSDNIRLGLDLKGGSHLVMTVQVQDAVKADADQTMERLKDDLKKQNITWASMDVNEPRDIADANKVDVTVKGVPVAQTAAFRSLVSERYPHLPADRAQFHRLLVEVEAHRAGESRARYRAAHHGHHRQPHRPAWPGREGRPAVRRRDPNIRFWSSCPAWTIPPA